MTARPATPDPIGRFLDRQGFLILDGGLATELEAHGADLGDHLWSARLLRDDPALIARVHGEFLDAGADCIASASYQATIEGFRRRGLADGAAVGLLRRSVELARDVRDGFWRLRDGEGGRLRPLVAASIGPYGAYLADGSEYTGDYGLDEDALADFHRRRLDVLAGCGADLVAFETIPSRVEARALARLLRELEDAGRPAWSWISFSCRDRRHLADGSELAAAAADVAAVASVAAVGVNCVPPRRVSDLVAEIRRATDKPVAVYPNSGEPWDAVGKRWLEPTETSDLASFAREWWDAGARLFGGCCRTRPADVRQLRARLRSSPRL